MSQNNKHKNSSIIQHSVLITIFIIDKYASEEQNIVNRKLSTVYHAPLISIFTPTVARLISRQPQPHNQIRVPPAIYSILYA